MIARCSYCDMVISYMLHTHTFTLPAAAVAKYCNEYVCVCVCARGCVCVSVCPRGYLRNHTQ